jgi:hypothetical protein
MFFTSWATINFSRKTSHYRVGSLVSYERKHRLHLSVIKSALMMKSELSLKRWYTARVLHDATTQMIFCLCRNGSCLIKNMEFEGLLLRSRQWNIRIPQRRGISGSAQQLSVFRWKAWTVDLVNCGSWNRLPKKSALPLFVSVAETSQSERWPGCVCAGQERADSGQEPKHFCPSDSLSCSAKSETRYSLHSLMTIVTAIYNVY